MRANDLRNLLRAQPFRPLRIHLSDGTVFEVRHPDMVIVGASTAEVDLPSDPDQERRAIVSLTHIAWVEVIAPAP